MENFISTLRSEVKATQDARRTITNDAVQAEIQYSDAVATAHNVVGFRIPSRATVRSSATAKTMNRSVKSMNATTTTTATAAEMGQSEDTEKHVHFDEDQDIAALMAFKPKRH